MFKLGSSFRSLVLQNRVFFLSSIALVAFIGLSVFAFSTHSQSKTDAVSQSQDELSKKSVGTDPDALPSPTPDNTPHWLAGSYYDVRDELAATLMLNNKGILPLEVTPTLYSYTG